MEKELNIAAILQDKPQETKLWSPIYGNCKFLSIVGKTRPIQVTSKSGTHYFRENARYNEYGEICLFPSKQMQDWSKFAWKKGDVLTDEKRYVIFNSFENDDYTEFFAPFKYNNTFRRDLGLITNEFRKVNDDIAQEVIKKIEEHYGGKLNLETLEIEKQPEFKDGDILYMNGCRLIYIFKKKVQKSATTLYYASLDADYNSLYYNNAMEDVHGSRLATKEEKQQLFDALAKEGKRWNPDTKLFEDLPKKCEFKPMDWCLMKDSTKYWELCQFAYTRKVHGTTIYSAVGGLIYYKCIPYNEETKHLLGTTDEWKGGK